MVVTDLSQSPDVEVLGTDRLHRILTDLHRADDRITSAEVVDEVARRAGVETVLLGSYVKAGDTFRINLKLKEATTGRIVTAERIDGAGEAVQRPRFGCAGLSMLPPRRSSVSGPFFLRSINSLTFLASPLDTTF